MMQPQGLGRPQESDVGGVGIIAGLNVGPRASIYPSLLCHLSLLGIYKWPCPGREQQAVSWEG
jgi:hypothetical protein